MQLFQLYSFGFEKKVFLEGLHIFDIYLVCPKYSIQCHPMDFLLTLIRVYTSKQALLLLFSASIYLFLSHLSYETKHFCMDIIQFNYRVLDTGLTIILTIILIKLHTRQSNDDCFFSACALKLRKWEAIFHQFCFQYIAHWLWQAGSLSWSHTLCILRNSPFSHPVDTENFSHGDS